MAKKEINSVDEYLASRPDEIREILERVRKVIRKAVPACEESISYKIPTFKLHGRPVLFIACWKEHFSLYPVGDRLEAFRKELAPYKLSKGTVRFPLDQPVPTKLISRIAKYRAQQIVEREKAKPAARKKR
jgi:uncharacterized protein YdhG (YjbR/CyaY superfamily)